MTSVSIAAVVVTYNRERLLRVCLEALLNQTHQLDRVIVIDNGSSDGTIAMLESDFGGVEIVRSNANIGGAGGFCLGVDVALTRSVDYVWLMDDDAEPDRGAAHSLAEAADRLRLVNGVWPSFLACHVVDESGSTISTHNVIGEPDSELFRSLGVSRISHASFVGVMVRAEDALRTWLPVADFFIYHDDLEYTSRLAQMNGGYRVQESYIRHPDKSKELADYGTRIYNDVRNRLWVSRSADLSSKDVRLTIARDVVRRVVVHSKRSDRKLEYFSAALRGLIAGIRSQPLRLWHGEAVRRYARRFDRQ